MIHAAALIALVYVLPALFLYLIMVGTNWPKRDAARLAALWPLLGIITLLFGTA